MHVSAKKYYAVIFLLFLVSGFCGLLYQIVWLRLAFTAFGIITPVLSVVISVFMLGLAAGSWAGGRYITTLTSRTGWSAIAFYGLTEVLIGIGGILVPRLFSAGQNLLLTAGSFDSFRYLVFSAVILGISILPWCVLMGATIPFMMAFIKRMDFANKTGFSYLYLANVIGAMCGTVVTAGLLIELLGLHHSLLLAACSNFAIGILSIILSLRCSCPEAAIVDEKRVIDNVFVETVKRGVVISILFTTGFTSMALEVIWTRAFTPVLSTTVYSFAAILFVYLLATWIGSWVYRKHSSERKAIDISDIMMYLLCFCLLPIIGGDPRIDWVTKPVIVLVSIFPFCLVLGYLTPKLVDQISDGDPRAGGRAYAVNTIGCILGPLFAGYLLLPTLGVKFSQILLAIPLAVYVVYYFRSVLATAFAVLLFASTEFFLTYEDSIFYSSAVVRRDYVATVVSCGEGGMKQLLVNGIGMAGLTPVTKYMAHLSFAVREKKPESALVICFGVGTTFRSAVSWGVKATAIELVPSVRDAFGFYFEDANQILKRPNAKVIIDDGRRFLMRTCEKFDVINIDPPPPVEASGSGLLYSEEFYRILKLRLKEDGILQQWLPSSGDTWTLHGGDKVILWSVANALRKVFPYVRVFQEGGFLFLASMQPFDMPDADSFAARIPPSAAADFIEWNPDKTPGQLYQELVDREMPLRLVLPEDITCSITDDHPLNEYFVIRRFRAGLLN